MIPEYINDKHAQELRAIAARLMSPTSNQDQVNIAAELLDLAMFHFEAVQKFCLPEIKERINAVKSAQLED